MADLKLTMFAEQAMCLSMRFQLAFGKGLEGPIPCRLELAAPDGPSTGGGKLALQHIKLTPENGRTTLMMGSANLVDKTVELRTWSYLAALHEQHFKGVKLTIHAEQYKSIIKQIQTFFHEQGMSVVMLEVPPGEELSSRPRHDASKSGVATALGLGITLMVVLLVVTAGLVFFLARTHSG